MLTSLWLMSAIPQQHVEVLNRLGQALSHCAAERASYPDVVERLKQILGGVSISLWLIGPRRQALAREAGSLRGEPAPDWLAFDGQLAAWQRTHVTPLALRSPGEYPVELRPPGPMPFTALISLPILYREASICGILNLYGHEDAPLPMAGEGDAFQLELFRGVAGQMAIFVENRALETGSLLVREMHHRVKNNLQIVASLLQMQLRRLDRISAAQALHDSISRIQSIAVVHDRLSRSDIGRVDFVDLVHRLADSVATTSAPGVDVQVEAGDSPIMLDSAEATPAALVANELIQNAVRHGAGVDGGGSVRVRVRAEGDRVHLEVQDDGPGLPPGFDLARDAHLGLTIVTTLMTGELHGDFGLKGDRGTLAWASFTVDTSAAADGSNPA